MLSNRRANTGYPCYALAQQKGFQIVQHMCMDRMGSTRVARMTRQKLRLDWDDNRKRQLVRASQVLFVAIKKSMWFIFIFFIIIYISYMNDSCVLYKLGKYFCHMAIKSNETCL